MFKFTILASVISIGLCSIIPKWTYDPDEQVIASETVTNWGAWGRTESCSGDSYAVGFRQRVQSDQGVDFDNTALNEIEIICEDGKRINGNATGGVGEWSQEQKCDPGQYLFGFKLKQQEPQESGDNTAANGISFICDNLQGKWLVAENDGPWGSYRSIITCPQDTCICGISVQIDNPEDRSGEQDKTALNNVQFECCEKIFDLN